MSGVLNYFGKVDLVSDEHNETEDKGIKIRPVLLRKGTTHLGLYGVGNVKDARMHYELRSNRVKMFMPEGGDVPEEDWFNILLVHQNRWVLCMPCGALTRASNTALSSLYPKACSTMPSSLWSGATSMTAGSGPRLWRENPTISRSLAARWPQVLPRERLSRST